MPLRLTIKPVQLRAGVPEFSLEVEPSLTVAELKERIAERVGLPRADIRLVCAGRIWQDVSSVAAYGPQDGATVHCLNNAPRAAAPARQPAAAPAAAVARAAAGGGGAYQQVMAEAHAMMQSPEVMQQMMSTPAVQRLLADPATLRATLRANPQLSRLMDERPEVARLLEDPEVLQQSLRLAANPSLLRELTRSADRAIGRLDALPGGHDALVRAHADFADPLYEALSGSSGSNEGISSLPTYTQSTDGGPNSAALPNPWGAPQPAPSPAPAPAAAQAPAAADPLMALLGGRSPVGAGLGGAGQAQGAQGNPMASMMQQMMSDPAQMQQMMGMVRQMMQPQAGVAGLARQQAPTQPPPTDLRQLQQMMAMSQQLLGGGALGAGAAAPQPAAAPAAREGALPADLALSRVRFASQLSQLLGMGFTNETACLRALAQHGGRLDAAIDALLALPPEGPSS